MEYIIKGRKPESFFRFFEEISAIPRQSFHEEKIADYLVEFAKARGLEYYRDEWHNVLVKKPATKGQEHRSPILLQGHTDMVCAKRDGVEHDFLKDPLKLLIDGKFLRAEGTTLGSDDGMAVAVMLSLLDGEIEEHPAYECLFTSAEEAGIVGAPKFDFSKISARTLINIDAGNEKYPLCSCTGALRTRIILPYEAEPLNKVPLRVSISGLAGGHAGADINKGRANANKLLGRLITALLPLEDVRIISVNSGSKESGIMRAAEAVLAVPNFEEAAALLKQCANAITAMLTAEDKNFSMKVDPAEATGMMSREATAHICNVLTCLPTGAFCMNPHLTYLVETSRNFDRVTTENNTVTFSFSTRSSQTAKLDAAQQELESFAKMIGARIEHFGRYPGWEYHAKSAVRDAYLRAYRETTGETAVAVGVHAGIECGVICHAIPDMDAIAIAPNVYNLHSPDEKMDLDSCERLFRVLRRTIALLA